MTQFFADADNGIDTADGLSQPHSCEARLMDLVQMKYETKIFPATVIDREKEGGLVEVVLIPLADFQYPLVENALREVNDGNM